MNTKRTFNHIVFPKRVNANALHPSMYVRITLNGKRTEFTINRDNEMKDWNEQSRRMNGKIRRQKNSILISTQ